ncbi:nitroreductase family deazaflavin-dependent oxidoreductase [Nocardia cyriacigeorgica]|uniref:Nitroreductase family deazaflavin-dependent oxidoreductase n=1 Tax=Nocardia cyriacigeorgica TaxID=135487 RepID=A0A6P1D2U9_9NOCA|nr:nitroreductase family deazaflavin-dependent oxidoreductase [Nocardia cyriacigeorgica]NEW38941.1 nitroreductase family deazaflavin-dependent oxidoreductase [Nocardia cyriacigeorgica]NEW43771.1 nitroreductase family deazaflavin-dependent oxidoreductase [Nocardia cyriacigeorgica]NEW50332.1 nitroreductase family deazaflavin-dependent oxidoreductase [Nocardia cyriacigeorgica]NEW54928.1 nitroreductase family deazaflavin-dependent oxidoreductase [Nocardia cyriacigeorgica]
MSDFNADVIRQFRANGGRVGGMFEGRDNMVLITTTGAKSGRRITNPLVYVPDNDRIVLIASNGGADRHPAWYHNLKANPALTVEVGTESYEATAEALTGEEADVLFDRMVELMPAFADYRANTTRRIPVVAVHRA